MGINYYGKNFEGKKKNYSSHTLPPEKLLERVTPFLKKMGFTRFADITWLDRIGIPVINAIRPVESGLSVSHGKGITKEDAMASALMESIERYHAFYKPVDFFWDSYENIKNCFNTIDLQNIPLCKHSVFHPKNNEPWTTGWDIVNKTEVVVPLALVSMKKLEYELDSFFRSTNGLAASANFVEALSQAILEVIERDATTLASLDAKRRKSCVLFKRVVPEVLKQFDIVKYLLRKIEKANIFWVLYDCTCDTKIPVFECHLIDLENPNFLLCKGMGASLNIETAIIRAITEAVQARAVVLSGVREAFIKSEIHLISLQDKKRIIEILSERKSEYWKWVDLSYLDNILMDTFEDEILFCVKKLKEVGLNQIIVKDITMDRCDFHVVRVLIPGLEGVGDFIYYSPGIRGKKILKGERKYESYCFCRSIY